MKHQSIIHSPVGGAYVEITGVSGDSDYTDSDGKCELSLTVNDTGSITVYASAPGFDTYIQEFNFENINTTMEIGLYADPYAPLAAPTPGPVTTAHQPSAHGVFVIEAETDVFGSHLGISELPVETEIPGYTGSGFVVITDVPTTITFFLDPRENNTYSYGWYSIGIRTYHDGEWSFQGSTHPEMLFLPEESCFMVKLVCPIEDYVIDRIVFYGTGLYETAQDLSLVPQTISLDVGGSTFWDTYRDLNLNAFILVQDPFVPPSVTPEPTNEPTPAEPEVVLEPDYISITYPETSDTATVTYAYTSGWSLVATNAEWLTVTPGEGTIGTEITATVDWSYFNPGDSKDTTVNFQNNGTSGLGTLDVHAYYPASITPDPTPTPEQTPPVSEPTSTISGSATPLAPTPTNSGTTSPPSVTTVATVAPTATSTSPPSSVILGDVNNSGSVDIIDALLVAQYYVGLNPSGFNNEAADTNCDGSVTIVDALLIAQYYVGLIEQFC
jgi:hypothetical protein